jgi:hypothetical protein
MNRVPYFEPPPNIRNLVIDMKNIPINDFQKHIGILPSTPIWDEKINIYISSFDYWCIFSHKVTNLTIKELADLVHQDLFDAADWSCVAQKQEWQGIGKPITPNVVFQDYAVKNLILQPNGDCFVFIAERTY